MRKDLELSSPDSCLNKAASDELIFVIRSHDVTSPGTVRDWIARRLAAGKNVITDAQIIEAQEWANTVEQEFQSKGREALVRLSKRQVRP